MNRGLVRRVVLLLAVAAVPSVASADGGLGDLPDDRLLGELAGRNLGDLLERAMDDLDTPEEQRRAYRVSVGLSRLESEQLTPDERRAAVEAVVDGIGAMLPTINDPELLTRQGTILITQGMQDDVNDLELWGEDAQIQSRLRPTAEATIAVLERAVTLGTQRLAVLEERIDGPNDTADIERYTQLDELVQGATYTRNVLDYYLALSLDPADPERGRLARGVVDYLAPYADGYSLDVLNLLNLVGKAAILVDDEEVRAEGRRAFDLVRDVEPGQIEADLPEAQTLEAVAAQQFDARYFGTLAAARSGDLEAAREQADSLAAWVEANQPGNLVSTVYAQVLAYRLAEIEARALSGEAREAKRREALDVLTRLADDYPSFRPVVMNRMLAALPAEPEVAGLDRLQLQAVVARAQDDYRAAFRGEAHDERRLATAVEAARELATREGVDEAARAEGLFQLGLLLEAAGDELAAAGAFLDFAAGPGKTDRDRGEAALDNAEYQVGRLLRERPDDPEVAALKNRFYPVAVNPPYDRTRFAVDYARQLLGFGEPEKAAVVLRKVTPDAADHDQARYLLLIALGSVIENETGGSRPELMVEIARLAEEVDRQLTRELAESEGPAREAVRRRLAGVRVQSAKLDLDVRNRPAEAVQKLADIESLTVDLPGGEALRGQALLLRFRAKSAAGSLAEASQDLIGYVREAGPERGVSLVVDFLSQLDAEVAEAERLGQGDRRRRLSEARAELTPRLVEFAREAGLGDSAVYTYELYDAESKRLAAEAAEGARREQLLDEAAAAFARLDAPENQQRYIELVGQERAGRLAYDPKVNLGLGRIAFARQDFGEAATRYGRLLADRATGRSVETVRDPQTGEVRQEYNDVYWETLLRWARSKMALGEAGENVKKPLRSAFIRYGENVGGPRWNAEYETLRRELLPELKPGV